MKDNSIELFGKHYFNKGIYFYGKKIGQMDIIEDEEELNFYNNDLIYIGNYDNCQSFGEGIIKIINIKR
jgi:hypothetical protein